MTHPNYHKWSAEELGKLQFHYSLGGVWQVRQVMPYLSDSQITSKAKKLGIKPPHARSPRGSYDNLAPLDPESVEPTKWDNPVIKHKAAGEWKADIPAVRWVFDLGTL